MKNSTKRILLANDVILKVRARAITAKRSNFLSAETRRDISNVVYADSNALRGTDCKLLQRVILDAPNCEACANGSLFLSMIGRFNGINFATLNATRHDSVYDSKLARIFGKRGLSQIEFLFENKRFSWQVKFSQVEYDALQKWRNKAAAKIRKAGVSDGQQFDDAMLIAIMEQIIANDGEKIVL